MRCFGSKRYALRCKNNARPGFVTCGVHQKQELVVTHHFADEIADELAAYARPPGKFLEPSRASGGASVEPESTQEQP